MAYCKYLVYEQRIRVRVGICLVFSRLPVKTNEFVYNLDLPDDIFGHNLKSKSLCMKLTIISEFTNS